ncbi:hypothetical protein BHE74_00011085 [Ensete ventricosum]|nr:hypothetical protein BHE74_00011085 [Ensete ventricosum]
MLYAEGSPTTMNDTISIFDLGSSPTMIGRVVVPTGEMESPINPVKYDATGRSWRENVGLTTKVLQIRIAWQTFLRHRTLFLAQKILWDSSAIAEESARLGPCKVCKLVHVGQARGVQFGSVHFLGNLHLGLAFMGSTRISVSGVGPAQSRKSWNLRRTAVRLVRPTEREYAAETFPLTRNYPVANLIFYSRHLRVPRSVHD